MKRKTLLTDNVILNGGDAAILRGTLVALSENTDIAINDCTIHCDYFDAAVSRYKELPLKRSVQESIIKFPPRFFWRIDRNLRFDFLSKIALSSQESIALKDYTNAEQIISCGGSFLTDSYDIRLTLMGYDIALKRKIPIYLLGQSLGPFQTESAKHEVAKRLQQFSKIIVRDHQSYLTALEMGCDKSRVIEARDMAFCIKSNDNVRKISPGKITVGISVRKWTYPNLPVLMRSEAHKKYQAEMARLIEAMVREHDINVLMISTCQGDDRYNFKDHQVAKEILEILPLQVREKVVINTDFQTPESFMHNLDKVDIFIGTRMHSCIMAFLKNIPTINICYEFKSLELFKDMDLESFVFDINDLDLEKIEEKFRETINQYDEISEKIMNNVERYRGINNNAVAKLFD